MIFKHTPANDLRARVGLCLVDARSRRPLTSRAEGLVKSLGKKGARLHLDTPFIDGCHILMDVHNTTPKLVQVSFPGENPETQEDIVFLGRVVTYQRVEMEKGARFEVELAWIEDPERGPTPTREVRRLIRILKKAPRPEAGQP